MKKLGLALCLLVGLAPAHAQTVQPGTANNPAGAYNTVAPTCTASGFCLFQVDVNGNLKTVPALGGSTAVSGTAIATSQVTVANTSTATIAQRVAGRVAVTITATGSSTQDIYCGPGTITTSTGDIILGVKGAARTYNTSAAINCITGSSTQVVTVSESY